MAIQTLTLATFLVLAMNHHAHAVDNSTQLDPNSYPNSQLGLSDHDVTILNIEEVHSIRKFIRLVSKFKSVRVNAPPNGDLKKCEEGMSDSLKTLARSLEHMKVMMMISGGGGPTSKKYAPTAHSLRDMVNQIINFNNFCHSALSSCDADGLIMQLLDKKLDDLYMLINNLLSRNPPLN